MFGIQSPVYRKLATAKAGAFIEPRVAVTPSELCGAAYAACAPLCVLLGLFSQSEVRVVHDTVVAVLSPATPRTTPPERTLASVIVPPFVVVVAVLVADPEFSRLCNSQAPM
jgi:hypothetical protein